MTNAPSRQILLPPVSRHLREFAARRDAWLTLAPNLIPVGGIYAFRWSAALAVFNYWFDGLTALMAIMAAMTPRAMRKTRKPADSLIKDGTGRRPDLVLSRRALSWRPISSWSYFRFKCCRSLVSGMGRLEAVDKHGIVDHVHGVEISLNATAGGRFLDADAHLDRSARKHIYVIQFDAHFLMR